MEISKQSSIIVANFPWKLNGIEYLNIIRDTGGTKDSICLLRKPKEGLWALHSILDCFYKTASPNELREIANIIDDLNAIDPDTVIRIKPGPYDTFDCYNLDGTFSRYRFNSEEWEKITYPKTKDGGADVNIK